MIGFRHTRCIDTRTQLKILPLLFTGALGSRIRFYSILYNNYFGNPITNTIMSSCGRYMHAASAALNEVASCMSPNKHLDWGFGAYGNTTLYSDCNRIICLIIQAAVFSSSLRESLDPCTKQERSPCSIFSNFQPSWSLEAPSIHLNTIPTKCPQKHHRAHETTHHKRPAKDAMTTSLTKAHQAKAGLGPGNST